MGVGCGRRGCVQCGGKLGYALIERDIVSYYGNIIGALQSAFRERRNYPGTIVRVTCTCGLSNDFGEMNGARVFLEIHRAHLTEWLVELVGIDNTVVWRMKAIFVVDNKG